MNSLAKLLLFSLGIISSLASYSQVSCGVSIGTPNGTELTCSRTAIMLDTTGGNVTFTTTCIWTWAGGNSSTNCAINATAPGTYTLKVSGTDGMGINCLDSISITITQNTTPPQNVKVSPDDTTVCLGDNAQLTVTGGGNYNYQWDPPIMSTNPSVSVGQGSYSVTATDPNNGCTAQANAIVRDTDLDVSIAATQLGVCNQSQSTSTLTATGTGGVGTQYDYVWNQASILNPINIDTSGQYTVVVTDVAGCTASNSINIISYAIPTVDIAPDPPSATFCVGQTFVKLTANPATGSSPFTYSWNTTDTTQEITVNQRRNYLVTVTDANNCTATKNEFVSEALPPTATVTASPLGLCENQTSSELLVDVNGGLPVFDFRWDGGSTDNPRMVRSSGTYNVVVTDANNCRDTAGTTVVSYPIPSVSISALNQGLCPSQTKDTLTANVMGGMPPYDFDWSNGFAQETLEVDSSGFYSVMVTDENGCSATANQTIANFSLPTVIVLPIMDTICEGQSAVDLIALGAQTYKWTLPDGRDTISNTYRAKVGGTYLVAGTNVNGCMDDSSAFVHAECIPTGVGILDNDPICERGARVLRATFSGCSDDALSQKQYIWERRNDNGSWTIVGTNSDTLQTGEISQSTTYRVTASTRCATDLVGTTTVSVIPTPSPDLVGPTQVCRGQEAIYHLTGDASLFQFSDIDWAVSGEDSITYYADSAMVLIKWGDQPGTFELNAKQRIDDCRGDAKLTIEIRDSQAEDSVDIVYYRFNHIFICTKGGQSCYRWGYYDPQINEMDTIPGETYQIYAAGERFREERHYWVITRNDDCSNSGDACINVSVFRQKTDTLEEEFDPTFTLFPNPNQGHFNLRAGEFPPSEYKLSIIDAAGKRIWTNELNILDGRLEEEMHLTFLAKGLYTLIIQNKWGLYQSQIFMVTD